MLRQIAALLVLAGMSGATVLAKPPGLPTNQQDSCLEKPAQHEIHSDLVVPVPTIVTPKATSGGTVQVEFDLRAAWDQLWGKKQAKVSSSSACPFRQAQAQKSQPQNIPVAASVLENLDKLDQARKLYEHAEQERHMDHIVNATRTYEAVQKLCPGSRFDRDASSRLIELGVAPSHPEATDAEEEEDTARDWLFLSVTLDLKRGSLKIRCDSRLGAALEAACSFLEKVAD